MSFWLAVLFTFPRAQSFYEAQFPGARLSADSVARLDRLFGRDGQWWFEPPNGAVVWLDNDEAAIREFETAFAPLHSLKKLAPARRRGEVGALINRIAMQHRQMRSASVASDGGASLFEAAESFEHAGDDGATVVRLRIEGRRLNASEVVEQAQGACRTPVRLIASALDAGVLLLGGVHCDDAEAVAERLVQRSERIGWVDLQAAYYTLNRWGGVTVRAGANLTAVSSSVAQLDGAGQILALSDTGVEMGGCFFRDTRALPTTLVQAVPADTGHRKLRAYWSGSGGDLRDAPPGGGHGTHVAGTALGEAASGASALVARFNGVAPSARLAVIDLLPASGSGGFLQVPLVISSTLMRWSIDAGASVHTASWGADAGSRYTADEADLDLFAYRNRRFLMVFAAGNAGPFAPSISSPSYAKNVLSVGATMNGIESIALAQRPTRPAADYTPEWVSEFSSRGTAALAIRKPDLVAPGGPFVWSAASGGTSCTSTDNALDGFAGTSMATPAVAGAALLLRQYFAQQQPPIDPTASLLRAVLVASAQPMLGVFPRQRFATTQARIDASGHGRIALSSVLDSPTVQLAVLANEDRSVSEEKLVQSWCVSVVGGGSGGAVRTVVALSYADFPGDKILNDIRLRVVEDDTGVEPLVNERAEPERRSTNERTATSSRRFSVFVVLDRLAVDDRVDFSLVLALQRSSAETRLEVDSGGECAALPVDDEEVRPCEAPLLACSGHGALLGGECVCLDGWTGDACQLCSVPADVARTARHCLGVPRRLLGTGAVAQRVPVVVQRNSVAARLTGTFYNRTVAKTSDGVPGVGGLDCWCLAVAERLVSERFSSHADLLAAAIAQRSALEALATNSQTVLAGQPLASAAAAPKSAAAAVRTPLLILVLLPLRFL